MGSERIPEIPFFGRIRTGEIRVWVRLTSKSGETVLGSEFFVRVALGPETVKRNEHCRRWLRWTAIALDNQPRHWLV